MSVRAAVTVLIPLFNKGRHIARALDSVRAQVRLPDEIIVVDDGSTDEGPAIVRGYPEVRLLTRTVSGAGGYAARNLGIEHARNDWIGLLDADDEWHPEHLARMTNFLAKTPDVVMACASYRERRSPSLVQLDPYTRCNPARGDERLLFDQFVRLWLKVKDCPVWTSATFVRRRAVLQVGGFPEHKCRRGGDKDLWLRLSRTGAVGLSAHVGATYHKDADNMVTAIPHYNIPHCIEPTIIKLMRTGNYSERRVLRRLLNLQIYRYALRTAKQTRLFRSSWQSLTFRHDPIKFLVLAILSSSWGTRAAALGLHGLRLIR